MGDLTHGFDVVTHSRHFTLNVLSLSQVSGEEQKPGENFEEERENFGAKLN